MIRAAKYCRSLLGKRTSNILHEANVLGAIGVSCLGSRSSSTIPMKQHEAEIPSNLRFDRKSSFSQDEGLLLRLMDSGKTEDRDDYDQLENEDHDQVIDEEITLPEVGTIPLPDRLTTQVYNGVGGNVSGTVLLESSVFGIDPVRVDLIKQSVDYIRNKIRGRRKAKSKTISEVSGSGRKVRQQKGSGKARAGHSRPAHWRGGAKAHGPKNVVDYGKTKMNKKTKRLAMASTLSQKLKEGNLIIVDDLLLDSHKTAPLASMLMSCYGIGGEGVSALIVDQYHEGAVSEGDSESSHASYNGVPINLWVASGNVSKVKVVNQRFVNVYDILKKDKLILTLNALKKIESSWKS